MPNQINISMEDFQYHASIQWPITNVNNIKAWFSEIYDLEHWLNDNIGNHMQYWAYINHTDKLTIGFTKPEHKTFYLIAYTK